MGLKLVLDSLDGVDEATQKLYTKKDDKFHLLVDDLEDTGALKRAKDHEKERARKAEERSRTLEEELNSFKSKQQKEEEEGHKKKGDVDALEKSWQGKLDKQKSEYENQLGVMTGSLNKLLVDNVATQIAARISTAPDVILPHVKARLKPEFTDVVAVTKVVNADGSPSALTLDELADEFRSSPSFAAIIIGSKGTGGGGHGDGKDKGKGGGDLPKTMAECKNPQQKADWLRANNRVPQ